MSRLLYHRCYLCGGMDRVPDGGTEWRLKITPFLRSIGVVVMDPTNKPCNFGIENKEIRNIRQKAKMMNDYGPVLNDKEVRAVDLRMVDVSDFLVCKIDMNFHLCGSYEEIFLANRQKKPILIVCEDGVGKLPDWLFWTLPNDWFFDSFDKLKIYLIDVAVNPNFKERKKRWMFFDYAKLQSQVYK